MRRRRVVVFVAASAAVVALLTWALLPYLFPPVYHAIDIAMEERNRLDMYFEVGEEEVKVLLPTKAQTFKYPNVYVRVGLGHLSIAGKNYNFVFASFGIHIYNLPVGPKGYAGPVHHYVLGFFTNNSELGEVLRSYGVPHTYVQATYSYVSEGTVNRTLLSMTYPDGSPLLELSAITPKATERIDYEPPKLNWYHLNDNNLTIIHLSERFYPYHVPYEFAYAGHVNVTFSENSEPWKYTGKTAYAIGKIVMTVPVIYNVGKMGGIMWR